MDYYDFNSEEEKFPSHIKWNLSNEIINKLKSHFDMNNHEFTKSLIFNTKTKINEQNETIRISQKCSIKDTQSFDLVNELVVNELNKLIGDQEITMKLRTDELELIRYSEGGFFKKHKDFVNCVSDQMKCYALLICLNAPDEGGETKLHFSDDVMENISETKTLGGCLIFRNEIVHEGAEIIKGTKILLKANIWCFKNYNDVVDDNKNFIVGFSDDERFYILTDSMYDKFPQSIFFLHKNFEKTSAIILKNTTYEEFMPIFNLMKGNVKLNEFNFNESGELLDYLGITNVNIKMFETFNKKLLQKYEDKMHELNQFLHNKNGLWLVKSFTDYLLYKKILKNNHNIIPLQFMLTYEDKHLEKLQLEFLSIYDSVPICKKSRNDCDNYHWLNTNDLENNDGYLKISLIRFLMAKKYLVGKSNEDDGDDVDNKENEEENEEKIEEDNEEEIEEESNVSISDESENNDNDISSTIPIKNDMINANNDYSFLKSLMDFYFTIKTYEYESDYWEPKEKTINKKDNSQIIECDKLKDAIKLIRENNLIEIIKDVNNNKNVCARDYIAGAYDCNQASYYIHHANIYFGFINFQ